jgi:LPS sulfotransferase NodH
VMRASASSRCTVGTAGMVHLKAIARLLCFEIVASGGHVGFRVKWSPLSSKKYVGREMFDGYIICATPRSGSTLLCNLLASTRKTGNPNSYYHRTEIMSHWAAEWSLPGRDTMSANEFSIAYLEATIKAGRGETNVFGLRLMREYLEGLLSVLDQLFPGLPSDVHRFECAFGNVLYIHLTRENKLSQAISLVRAEQSGLWHIAPDGTEIERLGLPQDPKYDFKLIQRKLTKLEAHDAAWSEWFDQQGITPLRVEYEILSEAPAGTLIRICEALGVEVKKADAARPGVAKLANEISLDWMRRFHADLSSGT